jgi:molybdate transport system substrate-binding protein
MAVRPFVRHRASLLLLCLLVQAQTRADDTLIVMTSGAFTAPHLELAPEYERSSKVKVVTAATSMGTGAESIPSRLQRGEAVDVVIVAGDALDALIADGRIVAGSRVDLARSAIGIAVRAGSPRPDISSVAALTRALLAAQSVAVSASVSGDYVTKELLPRLGIASQMANKVRRIERERVGAVVARGDAEIGIQQVSELLPIAGLDYIGPLPAEVQRVTTFAAGIGVNAKHPDAARAFIRFLASPGSASVVTKSGLEPIGARSRR